MRLGLQWKILLATVVPVLGLTVAGLWTVNRSISEQAQRNIRDDLVRAASIFEDMLASRAEELVVASQVIVEDPKFFSVLTLPGAGNDPQARATAEGVASDFNAITQADLFLVFDAGGTLIADAGRVHVGARDWHHVIEPALAGRSDSRVLAASGRHFQVTMTPVRAGQRPIGVLVLGAGVGQQLAERLRSLTRSEVTFFSDREVTGSTLENAEDRRALSALVAGRVAAGLDPEGSVFDFAGADHRFVTVAREIHGSNPGEGQYYAIQRSLEAETAFLGPMRLALVEIGLLALVISLTVGYLIARGITAPVRSLVRGAEEMERGNYDYPLAPRASDEIGYLTLRFGDMRQRQRSYVKSLEEVARLKGDFIDVASHELRTPLSVLRGFLELLSAERLGPVTPAQREAVTAMEEGVVALTRVAENASRLAQVESDRLVLALGEHGVRQILEEAVARARETGSGRTVTVRTRADDAVGAATVDGPRLVEAVYHLVCNGIRFTPDGGSVEVEATRDGADLAIRVRDSGIGIPAERLGRLLDRSLMLRGSRNHHSSSTLEFNSAGLGLGIPIARAVAEAHGGTLSAQAAEGRGSVFTLRIPARSTSAEEEAA